MILDVTRAIRSPGKEFDFTLCEPMDDQVIFGETIAFDPVELTGRFSMLGNELRLHGKLHTLAHASCAYCLQPVTFPVFLTFDEAFLQVEKDMFSSNGETDPASEQFLFVGSKADLKQMALTLILFSLPLRFECKPECEDKKAFSQMNEDLACQKELPDQHPFSALQQLLTKDEEV